MKIEGKKEYKTAEEMGIPDDIIAMFTAAEVTAKCMTDYVNSNVLTDDEKFYMKRFVTYAEKYIEFIEKEIVGGE